MHEFSIAQSIIDQVLREITGRNLGKVTAVNVTVGGLSHVEPSNLAFCFDTLKVGTELSQARLVVTRTGITAKCRRCGRTFEVLCGDFRCPDSTLADVELPGYDELTLTGIEVENSDEEENPAEA